MEISAQPGSGPIEMLWAMMAQWTAGISPVNSSVLLAIGAMVTAVFYWRRARKTAQGDRSVQGELAMLRAIVASLPEPIYAKDAESRFMLANQATARAVGAASGTDLLGKTDFEFFPRELAAIFFEDEQALLRGGSAQVSKEEEITGPDGQTRHMQTTKLPLVDRRGKTVGLVGIGRNITARKVMEAELERARDELGFKSAHDSLTSLLNREAILEWLERELARSSRENSSFAVMLADVDRFKDVNDVHGHPTGDQVLREVVHRLLNSVRVYDLVGRYGGDQFLIVLPNCDGAAVALSRAERLRKDIASSPILTTKGPVLVTMSIGILATEERSNLSPIDLIHEVDAALFMAKAAGKNCCRLASVSLPALADA
jgi:diguanylate cyclase (GGDEF)-like protein/PAS domain S-box-containing protein